jgi:hypothetical protein
LRELQLLPLQLLLKEVCCTPILSLELPQQHVQVHLRVFVQVLVAAACSSAPGDTAATAAAAADPV